jgi:hypothetical protein
MIDLTKPIFIERQIKEYVSVLEKALKNTQGSGPIKFIPISPEMVNPLNYPISLYPELKKIGNDRIRKMIDIGITPLKIISDSDGDSYCSKNYPWNELVSDETMNQAIDILTTYATVRTWQDKLDAVRADLPKLNALERIL